MKNSTGLLLALLLFGQIATAQNNDDIQGPTLGVHFFFNDFKSAQAIRANTLSTVLKNKEMAKIKDMAPGLAINFINGINKYFDYSATLSGSFVDYPMPNKPAFGEDNLLLEADLSIRGKMTSNGYWVNPYLQAGIGASKYKGYYGAFVPVGMGMQVNMFDEVFLIISAQYRIPVTETVNYHFYYSLGLAGNIGKKKAK